MKPTTARAAPVAANAAKPRVTPTQITAMLLDMMRAGSDASRVSAAKILLARMTMKKTNNVLSRRQTAARAAAIAEAEALLAQLAAAKSAGAGRKAALAGERQAGAVDAPALAAKAGRKKRGAQEK